MNTYQVRCIAFPLPIERMQAENSFLARKDYAKRHGCQLTDCYAKRIWDVDPLLDEQTLASLAGSRTAFLDLDGESEVKDTEATARAIDLDPEVEAAFDENAAAMDTSIRELDLEDMLA